MRKNERKSSRTKVEIGENVVIENKEILENVLQTHGRGQGKRIYRKERVPI